MKRIAFPVILFLVSSLVIRGGILFVPGSDPPVRFSVAHGFYYAPFTVELFSSSGSGIFYTTDGSLPTASAGKPYTAPLTISTTTVLRAVAVDNSIAGEAITSSYLFPVDIIRQSNSLEGYPSTWGKYTSISGTAIADYAMDPDIVYHPDYRDLIIPSLLSVPTVSIVTDKGYLFSNNNNAETGGIYIYTGANGSTGDNWERPVSVELIVPGSDEGFQVNCGLQIQGGAGRLAEKNPKHSFRLAFRDTYGPGKLSYRLLGDSAAGKFNGIVLRASFGNTWRHWQADQRNRTTHIPDIWAKDTQLEMGHVSAHSRFVHLYLNGIYWGLYNFSERLDDDFMESYFGGKKEDYDIIKDYNELMDGNMDAWNYLWSAVSGNISDNTVYQKLIGNSPDGSVNPQYQAYIDPVNLCDYMLINFYGGNNDWDHHNWVAGRNRVNPGKGFSFFCWDTEKIFENVNENYLNENNAQRPSGIFRKLWANQEFKLLFADRVNHLLSNGGLLTPEPVENRWLKRANEIDTAMIAESARWGDYRRDVHPYSSGPYYLYTYKDYWLVEKNRLITSYFPARTQIVLNQLTSAGMLPAINAPQFSQSGGEVTPGFRLKITAGKGTVYYTTDGTDPRMVGGGINPSAISYINPVGIEEKTVVKARARSGDVWSALTEATFNSGIYQPVTVIPQNAAGAMTPYPNPFRDFVTIRYNLQESGNVELQVFHMDGRLVSSVNIGPNDPGRHTFTWQPDHLKSGIYILRLTCGKKQYLAKVAKVTR